MNLTIDFAIYIKENNIDINKWNAEDHFKLFKQKLVSDTKEMEMCDCELSIGDFVRVETYSNGKRTGILEGKIKELYPYIPQVKLMSGWCFHPYDKIILHTKAQY